MMTLPRVNIHTHVHTYIHVPTERFLPDDDAPKDEGSKKLIIITEESGSDKQKQGQAPECAAAASRDETMDSDKKSKKGDEPMGKVKKNDANNPEKQVNDPKCDIQVVPTEDETAKKETEAQRAGGKDKDGPSAADQSKDASILHQNDTDQGRTREPKGVLEVSAGHTAVWSEEQIALVQVRVCMMCICVCVNVGGCVRGLGRPYCCLGRGANFPCLGTCMYTYIMCMRIRGCMLCYTERGSNFASFFFPGHMCVYVYVCMYVCTMYVGRCRCSLESVCHKYNTYIYTYIHTCTYTHS